MQDIPKVYVYVYVEDILIFSPDGNTQVQHVREVLLCLLQHQLYIKTDRCEFHQPSVSFLGFVFAEDEVKMDPEKASTVKDWPIPTTHRGARVFEFC